MADVFNFQLGEIITDEKLQKYLNKGWEGLSDDYKKSAKEIESETVDNFEKKSKFDKSVILKILGALREHIVDRTFKKAQGKDNRGNNEYFAAGSTNLTSDYDLAVSGPQANQIMWDMFKIFLKHYKEALPRAFDTNLYSSPLYIHTTKGDNVIPVVKETDLKIRTASKPKNKNDSLSGFPRVDYGRRQFTLIPQTEDEMKEELDWAGIKLLHKDIGGNYVIDDDDTKYGKLKEILERSKNLKTHLMKECDEIEEDDDFKDLIDNNFNFLNGQDETRKIFKNYYMQYKAQEKCQKYVYGQEEIRDIETVDGKEKRNIFYYSNKANYYSSEAYYTSSGVNAVVVENQLKRNLNYTGRENYLIRCKIAAALEQIGDMAHHIEHKDVNTEDDESLKKIIVKFSKYIYRFWYILGSIDGKEYQEYTERAENINDTIIPIRAKYDVKNIKEEDWKLLDVEKKVLEATGKDMEQAKKDWLKKLRANMLSKIEMILKTRGALSWEEREEKKERRRLNKEAKLPIRRIKSSEGGGKKKRTKKRQRKKKRKRTKRRKN